MSLIRVAIAIVLIAFANTARATAAADLIVLNYHDIIADPGSDRFAISRSLFVSHMDYLQQNGYRPITLDHLESVVAHRAPLPEKAVLLTFDDGLKSYRDFVVPVLEIYGYPSVSAVVTGWLDGVNLPREYQGKLMTWDDLRTLKQSRLVSIITHSHNMHHGVTANPQNNERGAATTRQYLAATQSYESEDQFRARIRNDLATSLARMKSELDIVPTALAWPYGEYDEVALGVAREFKLGTHFVLADNQLNRRAEGVLGRMLVVDSPKGAEFASMLAGPAAPQHRFVEFSLDPFIGMAAVQQEAMLSALLDRLAAMKVNTVVTSPVSADGKHAFFATSTVAASTNVLDRVLHQIRTRLNVRHLVLRIPEHAKVRDAKTFYTDLARTTRFSALLFESNVAKGMQAAAREIVPTYHVNARFGFIGDTSKASEYDFVMLPAGTMTSAQIDMTRVWVMADAVSDLVTRKSLEDKLIAQGISHFGFRIDGTMSYGESIQPGAAEVARKGG